MKNRTSQSIYQLNQWLIAVTTVLGLTFCSMVAMAEQRQAPMNDPMSQSRGDRPRGPEHLIELLQIEQSQEASFIQIMKSAHEQRMTILSQGLAKEDERAEMDALHRQIVAQLSAILSETQLQQFEQFAKANKPPRRH